MSQIEAPQGINTEVFASALPADQIPGPTEFQAPIIDQNPFTQRRQIKKIAGITGLVGTATLAFTGAVGAQEASPVPSQNPDTALDGEENCPPGYHTGSTEVVSGALQNGDIVNVSFPDASPLPSSSPAVEEVIPSPSPEPISVGGEPEETPSSDNPPAPEEPITITDPETGETIVCFPDEKPDVVEPTPTPEPLKTLDDLFEDKGKPKTAQVVKAINAAIKSDPTAGGQISEKDLKSLWKTCQTGSGPDPRKERNRVDFCNILVFNLFETYNKTRNEKYYDAARMVNNWTLNILPKNLRKPYRENLEFFFPTE